MRVVQGTKAVAAGAFVVLTAIGVHLGAQGQRPAYPQFQPPLSSNAARAQRPGRRHRGGPRPVVPRRRA